MNYLNSIPVYIGILLNGNGQHHYVKNPNTPKHTILWRGLSPDHEGGSNLKAYEFPAFPSQLSIIYSAAWCTGSPCVLCPYLLMRGLPMGLPCISQCCQVTWQHGLMQGSPMVKAWIFSTLPARDHSSPVNTIYGLSLLCSVFVLCFTFEITTVYAILCNNWLNCVWILKCILLHQSKGTNYLDSLIWCSKFYLKI